MNLYINDHSYQQHIAHDNPEMIIADFIQVCESARLFAFEKIFLPDNYMAINIINSYSFVTFKDSIKNPNALLTRFKSVLANQIRKISTDEKDSNIQYVYWANTESDFFRKALNQDTPVISFRTQPHFDGNHFDVKNKTLDANETVVVTNERVLNISHHSHFSTHADYLNKKLHQQSLLNNNWEAKYHPLRFVDAAAKYLNEINFKNEWEKADVNYRVKLANLAGTHIAELNGWEYMPKLTKRNQRKIFKALNQSIYLSIDTMHGTFELHDRNGIHLGEINFQAEPLEDAQDKHNIEI